jgi:hypothetical protein
MGTTYGRKEFGYFQNGNFIQNSNAGYTWGTINSSSAYEGQYCIQGVGGGGATGLGTEYIPVDTTQTYQMIAYARTLQRGSQNNSLAGGHIGFSCYDKNKNFIDLRNCGDIGNTTLSRNLTSGDSYVYLTSTTGWSTNPTVTFRTILLYPSTHPDYSTAHKYSRIGFGDYNIYYNSASITLMQEGDYRLELVNSSNVPTTFPNIGYSTPAGTPVSNGQAGGTYNYALSNPNYPETWTRYTTPPFTGESRNSEYPFRYGTKFITFMILRNYNFRTESPQDHIWALDNIFFGICQNGKDYRNML